MSSLRDHIKQQRKLANDPAHRQDAKTGAMASVYASDYTRKQRRGGSMTAAGVCSGQVEGVCLEGGTRGLSAREAMLADRQMHMAKERDDALASHKLRSAQKDSTVQKQQWEKQQQQRMDHEQYQEDQQRQSIERTATYKVLCCVIVCLP